MTMVRKLLRRPAARHLEVGVAVTALLLSGCGIVPKDGPTGLEVREQADVRLEDPGRLSYAFVKLSPLVLSTMQTEAQPPVLFSSLARRASKADVRVAASDTISVSIFEAGAGGLFVPAEAGARPGNFVQIPTQEVDKEGNISIPYGGSIRALGRTAREIERDIVDSLKSRAVEPQAIVTVGERISNAVVFLGDVRAPGTIPLRPGGMKLLTALARVGGPTAAAHSSIITIQRGARTEQALLTSVLRDPRQNIELAPEDLVYVSAQSRIFMAFGAVGTGTAAISIGLGGGASTPGRRFIIDRDNMSLTEALANGGGVSSGTADPRSVFLFRYMPRSTLANAGVDVSHFPSDKVPTVITVDLSQAEGYFLANQFFMKHNDIIYVSESPSVDLQKFLSILNSVNSTGQSLLSSYSQVQALR
jgi:polysaccharide export outer membrane protein